jgi:hypothetical protein
VNRDEIIRFLLAELGEDPDSAQQDGPPAWMVALADAAAALPLNEVPAVLQRELRDLPNQRPRLRYEAVLVRDSRQEGILVGARGDAEEESWSLTYSCEVEDVVLDISTHPEEGLTVDGHVMRHAAEPNPVRATLAGPTMAGADGDHLGRFRFAGLETGEYLLALDDGAAIVELALDLGSPSP